MTNKEILTAVIIEWIKPVIPFLLGNRLNNVPALNMFQNWVKNIGIAPPDWNITQDLTPIIQGAAYQILTPIILPRLNNIPDEYIPQMAHGIVDYALQTGELKFFGGNILFDRKDLDELKKYLDCNLPYTPIEQYKVIKPDTADGKENTAENK